MIEIGNTKVVIGYCNTSIEGCSNPETTGEHIDRGVSGQVFYSRFCFDENQIYKFTGSISLENKRSSKTLTL